MTRPSCRALRRGVEKRTEMKPSRKMRAKRRRRRRRRVHASGVNQKVFQKKIKGPTSTKTNRTNRFWPSFELLRTTELLSTVGATSVTTATVAGRQSSKGDCRSSLFKKSCRILFSSFRLRRNRQTINNRHSSGNNKQC